MSVHITLTDANADGVRPRVLRQQLEASIAKMKRDRIDMPDGGYVVECSSAVFRMLHGKGIRGANIVRVAAPGKPGKHECSMCSRVATHRIKNASDLLCGAHRGWCEKRSIETAALW